MKERAEGFELLKEPKILEGAKTAADTAMAALGWKIDHHPGLYGLFHLIGMYLVAGHSDFKNIASLDKNHVPYLIRHGLPAIRKTGLSQPEHDLLGKHQPAAKPKMDIYDFLTTRSDTSGSQEPQVIDALAKGANRGVSEKLFMFSTSNLTVEDWLRAVLFEDKDPLMNDFWGESKEIAPEAVGTGEPRAQGAILEQRHAAKAMAPPSQWADIAAGFFELMRKHNR